jgi:DNA polymerase-1
LAEVTLNTSLAGKKFVLVDGSSLAFRSFFALFTSGLRTKAGQPTWAILGFFNALFDLIERYEPDMLAVCFDLSEPTFRHTEFADYKANRTEMPDDLAKQWPLIKEGVAVMGLPVYEIAGYEADDLIGTIAKQAESEQIKVMILTGDQDAFQLVDGSEQSIKVLMPSKTGLQLFGRQEVFDKLAVWPEQIVDYKGLSGDSSDNIPGVKGIGPKTAAQLLSLYGTISGIYENIDSISAKALKQKLIDGKTIAYTSRDLATIRLDVPLAFDFWHCHLSPPELEKVASFFSNLEFKSLVNRLPKVFTHFHHTSFDQTTEPASDHSATIKPSHENHRVTQLKLQTTVCLAERETENLDKQSLLDSQSITTPTPPIILVTDATVLAAMLEKLERANILAINVVTSGEQPIYADLLGFAFVFSEALTDLPASNSVAPSPKHAASTSEFYFVPLANQSLFESDYLPRNQIQEAFAPIFASASIAKIVFNLKASANALYANGYELKGVRFDPMLASYIIQSDEKHSLKDQALRVLHSLPSFLNEAYGNKKTIAYEKLPISEMAKLACSEALLSAQLSQVYKKEMAADQANLLFNMELPLATVLAKMEQSGVALDLPFLDAFSKELGSSIEKLKNEIYQLAGREFNISSTQQLQKILFEELGLASKAKTKTGFSTDAAVLESLKNEHTIVAKILDLRQLSKLRSTYVDALPKLISNKDGRIHGEFNQTTTSTGRLSSSNPNLQNIPIRTEIGSRMRRAFVPKERDAYLLSADYSQIELRLLAHMSEDPTLIDAFERNQDIHARTAGEIFDKPIEEVTPEMRRIGKTLNFALIYQQGAYATAQALGVTNKEASQFIDKYFKTYGNVRDFLDQTIEDARKSGYVETLWKRRRYFRFLNDRNDTLRRQEERAACNAPIQGSAADLIKLAMIALDQQLLVRKLKSQLILQVHDELVLEVPAAELEETKIAVEEAMLLGQPFRVPLKVDFGFGKNWMDAK